MMTLGPAGPALFLLVLARVGGMVALAPFGGGGAIPIALRGAIALTLAVVFFPLASVSAEVPSGFALLSAAGGELALGAAMGFAATLLFAAARTGGAILDQELGLSMASVLDPAGQEPVALVAQYKLLLAGAAYVLVDGHHLLLRAVAESYGTIPLSGALDATGVGALVGGWGSAMFGFALKAAAPALVATLLVTLAAAFVTRVLPNQGAFTAGVPARLVVGQLVLAAGTAAFVYGFAAAAGQDGRSLRMTLDAIGGTR